MVKAQEAVKSFRKKKKGLKNFLDFDEKGAKMSIWPLRFIF